MPCPTCNQTMQSIGKDNPQDLAWWCPWCGTLTEVSAERIETARPAWMDWDWPATAQVRFEALEAIKLAGKVTGGSEIVIKAPFSREQVEALNRFQRSGRFHPFTCGSGNRTDAAHLDGEGILIATENGWHCPYCAFTQDWAHAVMVELGISVLKPWPSDAVMIVCAKSGQENRANMESVVKVECRDCGEALAADSKTIRLSEQSPVRRGRPIKYFCVACFTHYDPSSITHYADHSAAKDGGSVIKAANPNAVDIEGDA